MLNTDVRIRPGNGSGPNELESKTVRRQNQTSRVDSNELEGKTVRYGKGTYPSLICILTVMGRIYQAMADQQ